MSGPKVVRVVTREELVARCEGALARLDRCLQLWRQELNEMGRLTEASDQAVAQRRQELQRALTDARFADVLKQAAAEVEFMEADVDSQRQKHAEDEARKATRSDSARRTARELAVMLKSAGSAELALMAELGKLAQGHGSITDADAVLARALAALPSKPATGLSESQRALAQRLGSDVTEQTLQGWKAKHAERDKRFEPLNRLIAEVTALDARRAGPFQVRLTELKNMDDGAPRNLRLDSLTLDLTAEKAASQRLWRLRRDAALLSAELDAGDAQNGSRLRARLAALDNSPELFAAVINEEQAALEASRKRRAAQARRTAVLQGLANLGYTVTEGMSTALASAGRLVLQKPDMPGYGVEVVGGAQAERLQVRTVALAKSRDSTRDLGAETKWCSDFSSLREALAAAGTEVVIEQALPAGKVPLRVVEGEAEAEESRRSGGDSQQGARRLLGPGDR